MFEVSLRLDGHRPVPPKQGITIQPGETTHVTFFLQPIVRGDRRDLPEVTGTSQNWQWRIVRINSAPPDAALIVDDKELGVRTPATVLLESGLHHVQARWSDGARAFKNVTIDPGAVAARTGAAPGHLRTLHPPGHGYHPMKREIQRIEPVSAVRVGFILGLGLGVIFGLVEAVFLKLLAGSGGEAMLPAGAAELTKLSGGGILLLALSAGLMFSPVAGARSLGALTAMFYNLAAHFFGGIEMILMETSRSRTTRTTTIRARRMTSHE